MKKINSILIVPAIALLFCRCMGDHGSQHGKDTGTNTYGVAKDTSKVDSLPTDTTGIDNSGAGGPKPAKPDSAKKQ